MSRENRTTLLQPKSVPLVCCYIFTLFSLNLTTRAADASWVNTNAGTHVWFNGSNWNTLSFPGETANANSANADIANLEHTSLNGATMTIDFAAAGGYLTLGAIEFGSNPPLFISPLATTVIRPSDTSVATRVLMLNGATIQGVPNTILVSRDYGQDGPNISFSLGNGATPFSEVRLGSAANVIQVGARRSIQINSGVGAGAGTITEANPGSGITLTSATGQDLASFGSFLAVGANTFTGPVRIENHTRWTAGANVQGLGQSSPAAANLTLDNGTLVAGSTTAHGTARLFTLGSGGGTIEVSGVGEFSMTGTGDIAFEGTGSHTLTLSRAAGGGNTVANFAPRLTDASVGSATSLKLEGDALNSNNTMVWRLSNANTYSGNTTVGIRATLALVGNGSIANSPTISLTTTTAKIDSSGVNGGANHDGIRFALASGQTLNGIGTVVGAMSVRGGATLSPGLGIGSLSVSSLYFTAANAGLASEIDLSGAFSADLLMVTGVLDLGGAAFNLSLLNASATPGLPLTFLLINNDGSDAIANAFGVLNLFGANSAGYSYTVNYAFNGTDVLGRVGDGNDLAITLMVIPEPSSLTLVVMGISFQLVWNFKKHNRVKTTVQ